MNRRPSALECFIAVQVLIILFLAGSIFWRGTLPGMMFTLRHGDIRARISVAHDLAKLGPSAREALPDLERLMSDPDGGVQVSAAYAVSSIGGLDALANVMRTGDSDARRRAAEQLRGFPVTTAGDSILLENLLLQGMKDPNPLTRRSSVEGLGRLGPRAVDAGVPAITDLLDDDPSPEVRLAAIIAARDLHSLPTIVHGRFSSDRQVAMSSISALTSFGADGVSPLADALRDDDPAIAQAAAGSLALMGRTAVPAEDALVQALGRPEANVRTGAILALGAIGPENAPAIERMTADPEPYVRVTAKGVLDHLKSLPPPR